jgi:hypothetical protein
MQAYSSPALLGELKQELCNGRDTKHAQDKQEICIKYNWEISYEEEIG